MGSLGEIAIGERRMGWARPGRSAVLGLAAAAMGIERDNEDAHRSMETGLYYAVKTDALGRPFIDYHTAQTPKASRGRTFETRREELGADKLNTVLSSREWRSDTYFTIALWSRQNNTIDISTIAEALQRPRFALYLGRKSAPLGLPLNPVIIEADTFREAFEARQPTEEEETVLKHIRTDFTARTEIAYDYDVPTMRSNEFRIERRRDTIISRTRWQFADRLEIVEPEGGE